MLNVLLEYISTFRLLFRVTTILIFGLKMVIHILDRKACNNVACFCLLFYWFMGYIATLIFNILNHPMIANRIEKWRQRYYTQ